MQPTFTSDFKHEYEQAQHSWLQRRFLWYCGVILGLSVLGVLFIILMMLIPRLFVSDGDVNVALTTGTIITLVGSALNIALYAAAFVYAKRRPLKRDVLLRIVFWLIVLSGILTLVQTPIALSEQVPTKDGGSKSVNQLLERAAKPESAPAKPPETAIEDSAIAGGTEPPPPPIDAGAKTTPDETGSGDEAEEEPAPRVGRWTALGVMAGNLFNVFVTHIFACLFLPWTPRESVRPIVPLLVLNAVIMLFYIALAPVWTLIGLALSPLVAMPGLGICAWRQSRFKDTFTYRMLKSRYGEIRQELHSARQIHESLFPKPVRRGELLFDYRYTPMRQIGGDYLYARAFHLPDRAKPVLNVVVVDVTGHGITAALTVNRLFGEIEREFGEDPGTRPGELLTGLNSYLHHSLATHSVYATALCCRIDPNDDSVEWASAGHPPAFIRAVDGTVERMDSTTFVLGATRGDDFVPDAQKLRFAPGDRLVLYTDGAIEARNEQGRMLSVAGFERMIAATSEPGLNGVILDQLLDALERYRHGPPSDDTLLVEVMRAI